MSLLPRLAPLQVTGVVPASSVVWGIARRRDCFDLEDPGAHAGVTQHGYREGRDDEALCGYRPPTRRDERATGPRPSLAIPSDRYNPCCGRCESQIQPASAGSDAPMRLLERLGWTSRRVIKVEPAQRPQSLVQLMIPAVTGLDAPRSVSISVARAALASASWPAEPGLRAPVEGAA